MPYLVIAVTFGGLFVVNAIFGSVPGYRIAPVFLIGILTIVYFIRQRLDVSPFGYGLIASALLLHDLGAYGFYQKSPTPPVSFDMYIHVYFAVVGTAILYRALSRRLPWRAWQVGLTTLLLIMGVGACHEIMEYLTYLALGEERGMLKPSTSYRFDNERDLTCNLAGCVVTLAGILLFSSPWYSGERPGEGLARTT
jgi:uncharacterized membrane protein YjdF